MSHMGFVFAALFAVVTPGTEVLLTREYNFSEVWIRPWRPARFMPSDMKVKYERHGDGFYCSFGIKLDGQERYYMRALSGGEPWKFEIPPGLREEVEEYMPDFLLFCGNPPSEDILPY